MSVTRVSFWVPIFDPQPCVFLACSNPEVEAMPFCSVQLIATLDSSGAKVHSFCAGLPRQAVAVSEPSFGCTTEIPLIAT